MHQLVHLLYGNPLLVSSAAKFIKRTKFTIGKPLLQIHPSARWGVRWTCGFDHLLELVLVGALGGVGCWCSPVDTMACEAPLTEIMLVLSGVCSCNGDRWYWYEFVMGMIAAGRVVEGM